MAQDDIALPDDYDAAWARVDSLENEGLPRSALEVVEAIYERARADGDAPQRIKALIYQAKYTVRLEEDAAMQVVGRMRGEIDAAEGPTQAVLHSLLGDLYWRYYQANRWRIHDRTTTATPDTTDITTWDVQALIEAATDAYLASVAPAETLQATPLAAFDVLLTNGDAARDRRPTLYDVLAHRALGFLTNPEASLTTPDQAFVLEDPAYLAPLAEFIDLPLPDADAMGPEAHALALLQRLLALHRTQDHPAALLDANLQRLDLVYQNLAGPAAEKDTLYVDALTRLREDYADQPLGTEVTYTLARFYDRQGNQYEPGGSDAHKWDKRTAFRMCEEAVERFPEAWGAQNCEALRGSIQQKSLSLTATQTAVPGQPSPALLSYRNVPQVYVKAVAMSQDDLARLEQVRYDERSALIDTFAARPAVAATDFALPDDGDFQEHAVEIAVPALEAGTYLLLASTSETFTREGEALGYAVVQASSISYLSRRHGDGTYDLYVRHRATGHPLPGATVRLVSDDTRGGLLGAVDRLLEDQYRTDDEGYVRFDLPERQRVRLRITHAGDTLWSDERFYGGRYRDGRGTTLVTHFFTDRSIYRPGQTIYFKGILLRRDGDDHAIVPNEATRVRLFDVNRQEVAALELETNEYGTFSGQFVAPSGGLLGQMTIRDDHGSTSVSVEEYKRPRFEVTMEPPEGTPALEDTVTVEGQAMSYAGAAIDGGDVAYRVVRVPRWPPWFGRWFYAPVGGQEVEIEQGTTETDADGRFTVRFPALPDRTLEPDEHLRFVYRVTADVTDITGETRSATTRVTVGYRSLLLDLDLPERLDKTEADSLALTATNLNGQPEPTQGRLVVTRLQAPDRTFRAELWATPDRQVLSREAFYDTFPHDDYANEDELPNWPVQDTVLTQRFDTGAQDKVDLSVMSGWASGAYRVELHAEDDQGRPVTTTRYTVLFDPEDRRLPVPQADWFVPLKVEGEPGEEAAVLIGSSAEDARVLVEVEHQGAITSSQWLDVSSAQRRFAVPIEEQHRGNFAIHVAFVRDNRAYRHTQTIRVPYTNKQLDLELSTFRDKLKPGAEEEWRLTVKGPQGEAVAAEVLAAMYDMSLDAFRPHDWQFSIFPSYGARLGWSDATLRQTARLQFDARNWGPSYNFRALTYPRLNWFGFDYFGRRPLRMERSVMAVASAPQADGDAARMVDAEAEEVMVSDEAAKQDSAPEEVPEEPDLSEVEARTNLDETAFFFPHLRTNADGEVVLAFTMPEALTRWKLLTFGHTTDLSYGFLRQEVVTQKELMVTPNAPRFVRHGDTLRFAAKVTNLSDTTQAGHAQLFLFDAATMQPVDDLLGNADARRAFSVEAGRSTALAWTLEVPEDAPAALTYRVVADAGTFSDGEENVLPVLTNRTLVTETLPLPVKGDTTQTFTFDKLLGADSPTLRHHRLTLEFTPNPVWYAVQALPYLMEFPHECSEQIYSRFYANSIATHIVRQNPRIEQVYDEWRREDAGALVSNLEKNQELKSLLLDATPWVLDAQDETARKRRIAQLFKLDQMRNERRAALRTLAQMQQGDGAWPWFAGGPPNRYVTQHIATGLGHLMHLGVLTSEDADQVQAILRPALQWLDAQVRDDYERLVHTDADLDENHLGAIQIHYLYARSFFLDLAMSEEVREAHDYYRGQAQEYWLAQNRYLQGLVALALHRTGDAATPDAIVASLREYALHDDEMGMYWKQDAGFYWWQAPIETQALLIEVFHEVAGDEDAVEAMKQWLLKQKQTQDWRTTKATAAAVYALLLRGTDLTAEEAEVVIHLGELTVDSAEREDAEAGTGYFQAAWDGSVVTPEMGNITVEKTGSGIAWGAVYWQYFEQLDKVTP
ncbi:MAG: hypothetical protein GVY18_16155, partial [Bacteroidetes bacterium]|nr:hypothetical protein [Bacteroidota bacterium]